MVRKVMNPTVSRDPTASCVPSVTYMANGRRLDQSARGFLQRSGFQLTDQRSHRGKRRVELPLTFEEFTMDEAVVRPHPEPWNKGKLVGQKAPFKLKEIWAIRVKAPAVSQSARSRAIRPWYRQQAARLRSRQAEGPRHLPRRPRRRAGHRHATKDLSTGAVRDHRVHAGGRRRLDQGGRFALGRLPLPNRLHESLHLSTRQY